MGLCTAYHNRGAVFAGEPEEQGTAMGMHFVLNGAEKHSHRRKNTPYFLPPRSRSDKKNLLWFRFLGAVFLALTLCSCSGDSGEDLLAEGQKLLQENNPGGAVVLLKNALEKSPTDYATRLYLSRAYIALGKSEQAEAELQKCLRQKPDDPLLHVEFARLYVLMGKPRDALSHLETAEKWLPPTAEVLELAGLAHGLNNDFPAAANVLEQAVALAPQRESAVLALARVRLAERDLEKARDLVDGLLAHSPNNETALALRGDIAMRMKDNAKALSCFQMLTEINPGQENYRYMLGTLYLQQGNVEGASKQLAALLGKAGKTGKTAMTSMLEGMIAYTNKEYTAAANAFQESVTNVPTLEGYYRLALALYQAGNLETALSNAYRALNHSPQYAPALHLVSTILMQQNRLEEAQQEAERLVQRYPTASSHYLLGSILRARENHEEALKQYDAAANLDPKLEEAFVQRSAILFNIGKVDEAEKGLRDAISYNDDSHAARRALFSFYLGRRQYRQAEDVLRQGLEKLPDDVALLTMLATLYNVQGKNNEAQAAVEKARAGSPDYPPAFSLALRLHILAGDTEKALELCEDYLSRHPDATPHLITAAALLDQAGKQEKATEYLQKAWRQGDGRALALLVQRALAEGKGKEAQTLLSEALAARPVPAIRQSLANLYLGDNDFDKAWALYAALEKTNPDEAATGKFRLLTATGQYQEALALARNIQQATPGSPLGVILAAEALEKMGKPAEALAELQRAYANTEAVPLLVLMAQLCLRQNDLDKADALYRTVLQKEKNNLPALSGQAYTMLLRKKYTEAIAGYEQVLALNPDDVQAANNLAMAYALAGKFPDRALRLASMAYALQPENPGILDTLGLCLIQNKRFQEAAVVLERAIKVQPDSPLLHYRLGVALAASDNPEKARTALLQALKTGGFPEAEDARNLLETLKQ